MSKAFKKYYILLAAFVLAGCSPEATGPVANVYHNITARYNAWFYAKKRLKTVEQELESNYQRNFNSVLPVLVPVDTNVVNQVQEELDDCIKKASIAIERHPNSKWIDDCYILIGRSRRYNQDFSEAITTFKYVNTTSEDPAARHRSLIYLMRTFIAYEEYNNALAVGEYLLKQNLNADNKKLFFLTGAHFYQIREDYRNMGRYLLAAVPLLKKNERKADMHFILGQIFQDLDLDAQAYNQYEEVLKNNPDYELFFYARLNMAQVYDLNQEDDLKKIRKYFVKLLKDEKNVEFRDKIYYEMARFEQRQQNLGKAIEFYENSVAASQGNNRQKAYSYLELGKIYYNDQRDYEQASLYYDSTISVLPKDEENYQRIADRQQVLQEFVKQLKIINDNDSLIQLAQLNEAERLAYVNDIIAREQAAAEKAEAERRKEQQRQQLVSANNAPGNFGNQQSFNLSGQRGDTWYFYNPSSLSSGQNAFKSRWGDRPLEDNWRRSSRATAASSGSQEPGVPSPLAAEEQAALPDAAEDQTTRRRQELLASIPKSEEALGARMAEVEQAYLKLGTIYHYDLNEDNNAVEALETMLSRFPDSEFRAEVLYQLYLIYSEMNRSADASRVKSELVQQHPASIFAKLAINPNYKQETNLAVTQLKETYKKAYALFERRRYTEAREMLLDSLRKYPENDFVDNVEFLLTRIKGIRGGPEVYKQELQAFNTEFPESDMLAYSKESIASLQALNDDLEANTGDYQPQPADAHRYLIIFEDVGNLSLQIRNALKNFISTRYSKLELQTLDFGLGRKMIQLEGLANKKQALDFYYRVNENRVLSRLFTGSAVDAELAELVMSEDNYEQFYQKRDIRTYLRFFEKYYLQTTR